ncbi:MAG: acetyl-CoA carboxylase carboxyltransferase subunit beta [Candidatus Marinimicrobia bacterium]|jgi:acetyl-CoA carboxylase carboxyl transferase subunit beta|uniref:Acetyl-coenzyme A carboxylase carboxyl transferase subunit beta n=1 Tax=uncultured bacterium FGYC_13M19 TaxID=1343844 RepID=S4WB19_9BACT|nr:carboxylase carboxyl transferase subunits beta/alpha [uncultured bacterium FGYC_13M19]MBT3217407.1 acetyl-CoA carboxylase carboxyltransferase subunit beta [Candidatus Neomarinimicrobiota bacterium]MBT3618693.1 acetyl-CoA carboxylase carboxyltransferase subunit beta [Candidatus Neomarinimicrobiota bacterium]MBT3828559.1 acetyl-CoA carboxylase carboxyltransferase subunit beta [Candidatus Neomarinimicrobiota bacterium]MBT3996713.1 acetyl-CoA carboxylase carboxyltransferase subunit beta [Candida
MVWFKRKDKKITETDKKDIPGGLWIKCQSCSEILYQPEIEKRNSVCHHCNHHFRVNPQYYLDLLLDDEPETELFANLKSSDPLNFKAEKKYTDQLKVAESKAGDKDAISIYEGKIQTHDVILGIMNFKFIGGSMGSVLGEKLFRAIDRAQEKNIPLIVICASGGARMQEGAYSLMQLAKISAKLSQFSENGGLYIPILTDPTTGGATASFGMLGDIILAEPGALIGFAGPRVIKQTIGEDLPKGFQRSEFLLDKGFIDHIVSRESMKETLHNLISNLT